MPMQSITTGNISETPLKATASPHMSPTEKAAFAPETSPAPEPQAEPAAASEAEWENLGSETFNVGRFGDATNAFRRTTRRLKVEGGWIYSVSTQAIGYVRGSCSAGCSESTVFVPESKSKTK
jgi:hypothetical protein